MIFNDYFADIGKNFEKTSSFNETDIVFGSEIINSFVMSRVTEKEISASIRLLKSKESSGHDGIRNKLEKIFNSVNLQTLTI